MLRTKEESPMTDDSCKKLECHASLLQQEVSDIPAEDLHDPERYCSVQDLEDFLFQTFPHLSQEDIRHIAHDITYSPEKSTKEMLKATYGVAIDDAFHGRIDIAYLDRHDIVLL